MKNYLILLRGVNVGGKNKVSMTALKQCLEKLGYTNVITYIASGNVLLDSDLTVSAIQDQIEQALIKKFSLDSERIKVLVVSRQQLQHVIDAKPNGFGEQPDTYHSDVIFLMNIDVAEAMKVFTPREGIDKIWAGDNVIYSQRLSAERTKSRLNKIIGTPAYKSMTIRTWGTTTKLLQLMTS
jgi:uncharacterized protein (DUF1697 family)